ncbi:MAG: winged helix-turn-helix transcriptional regulator [Candidatus Aminicenantes bacterium]|nr:winged helix-turn-helix transcriptional regulator [Candidatus Aminicenantes bacterium]
MIEAITGSIVKERILLYLVLNPLSYPNEIARNFGFNLNAVQKQLLKLEDGRVVCSRLKGRVRLYEIDPRYPFKNELEALLRKVYSFMDQETKDKYYIKRTRPRKPGKEL